MDRAARGAVPEREGVGVEVGVRGAEAVRAELGGRGVARDCERPDASWESVAVWRSLLTVESELPPKITIRVALLAASLPSMALAK